MVVSLITAEPTGQISAEAVAASSGPEVKRLQELQLDLGEGPSRDAFLETRPVLVPDLEQATGRWAGYAPAACDTGARAVFAFPLHVGAARLGVLSLYRARPGMLSDEHIFDSLFLAELSTEILLNSPARPEPVSDSGAASRPALLATVDFRDQVYQAQGMVMVALGVSLGEALARMRAHAYVNNQDLSDLAADIVAGRTRLPSDRDGQ